MAQKEKESDIQFVICEYLAIRERQKMLTYWRQNTGGLYDPTRGVRRKMPAHSKKGVPDILVIKKGQFIGLEVKSEKGRQSPEQKLFELYITENGGRYHVVRSLKEVQALGI